MGQYNSNYPCFSVQETTSNPCTGAACVVKQKKWWPLENYNDFMVIKGSRTVGSITEDSYYVFLKAGTQWAKNYKKIVATSV